MVDRARRGRPPKLDVADLAFLRTALDQSPQADGLPVTVWSVRDVQALFLRARGVEVSVYTVHWASRRWGIATDAPGMTSPTAITRTRSSRPPQ